MIIGVLVNLVILAVVLGLMWWALTLLPIPEPFNRVVQVGLILILVVYMLSFLGGYAPPIYRYR